MKYFFSLLAVMLFSMNANAVTIKMLSKTDTGYEEPIYIINEENEKIKSAEKLITLAHHNLFPFSSSRQGTVFSELIERIVEKTRVYIKLEYDTNNFNNKVKVFERGSDYINALFGVPKEYYPYSKNEYIYPAFFENKLHVITIRGGGVVINTKDDLLKYKGVYVKKDNLSKFIINDFSSYKIQSAEDYSTAFEQLFTKKIDFIVAGYYPSQIEAYKIGIRDYIAYSKDAIWKNPLFLRIDYRLLNSASVNNLKKYMKTEEFKNIRNKVLEDVLEIYKKNTQGVVPPMYIGDRDDTTQTVDDAK